MQKTQREILNAQRNQNEILQQLLLAITSLNSRSGDTRVEGRTEQPEFQRTEMTSPRSQVSSAPSQHTTLGSISSSHAISLLASQIPEFGGQEAENVQLWIQRVEKVASIHKVSPDITLLAASSRLVKLAKRW
ncbi:hypothetical protein ALC60_04960 [Trachymyrmex zeteki]|uniref:Uncharacterized protein n=1 Tax=Mycetomoellerius zeteki TaxID=64791 RepID=A0A151X735_9HYME|nr:hypothetical protein ALC60_04960 [Trachymyrmex zeteki]